MNKVLFSMLMILCAVIGWYTFQAKSLCEDHGGTFVRAMIGFTCIVVQIDNPGGPFAD